MLVPILSPISYTLFTHTCVAYHKDNVILKFAEYTTVIGGGRDEATYKRNVASLVSWSEDNNLTFTTDKTNNTIVDMKKERRPHQPHSWLRG